MQGSNQAYAQARQPAEEAALAFKRYILEESAGFEQSPQADLLRVSFLSLMLDRFDDYQRNGADTQSGILYTKREFSNIPQRMREAGFMYLEQEEPVSDRRPAMTEDEAADYLKECSAQTHRIAIGVALCAACILPLMAMNGLSELMIGYAGDAEALIGLAGMFGMIGMGVYSITSAKKPDAAKRVKKKQFSLSARLRRKLTALKEATSEKSRRRKGVGIALCATCVIPIFLGAALDDIFWTYDAWSIMGVGGMFAMIGAGVYELIVADGEKKAVARLLKD